MVEKNSNMAALRSLLEVKVRCIVNGERCVVVRESDWEELMKILGECGCVEDTQKDEAT